MRIDELIRALEDKVAQHGPDLIVKLAVGTREAESFTVEDSAYIGVVVLESD